MAAPADQFTNDTIQAELTKVPGHDVEMDAFVARPPGEGPFPAVILIHENIGIDPQNDQAGPHFDDLTRRFARQGFVAVAPNCFQRGDGPESNPATQVVRDLKALFTWLQSQPYVKQDGIGCIGFCWGGGISIENAIANPDIDAAVIFYGRNPADLDSVQSLTCPVLGIYGELDQRITPPVPELEAAMQRHGKQFEAIVYPGAQHAFFNDRKTDRHHPQASADAWAKVLAFFNQHLRK